MGKIERDLIKNSRPSRSVGRADKYLPDIASDLRRLMRRTQDGFASRSCTLEEEGLLHLAIDLTGFAEDVHCDLGLWRALETYHQEFFNTPLPFFVEPDDTEALATFDSRRVQFLLWTLLPTHKEDENVKLLLGPHHADVQLLAEAVSRFLTERFAKMPRDSGIAPFLASANTQAGDIKRKLVWLGTQSYLFRSFFSEFADQQNRPIDIDIMDDFICEQCTAWCGLGATDILTIVLGLEGRDRSDLKNWQQRHTSFYRVMEVESRDNVVDFITARNTVNGEDYHIRVDLATDRFEPEVLIFGSLIPWRGSWYWSGNQRLYGRLSQDKEEEFRQLMLKQNTNIAYRYCGDKAEFARCSVKKNHGKFVAYYEDDLVIFPDGLAMASAEQQRMHTDWAAAPRADVKSGPCVSMG